MTEAIIPKRFHHGLIHHPIYDTWRRMRQRCNTTSHASFNNYGGRGIKVCERWNNFANFLSDMGEKPTPKHTLERIDNDLGYSPENCTWATWREQNNNTRFNKILSYNGKSLTITQWARRMGMKPNTLVYRIRLGWSVEDSINRPVGKYVRKSE